MKRRVVITGIGIVSPVGLDTSSSWNALLEGRSGIAPITRFDASAYTSQIAGEIKGFDAEKHMDRRDARRMDTFIHYAIAASREAVQDSGLAIDATNADAVGVYIGSGIGGMNLIENSHEEILSRGPRKISPFFIPGSVVNLAAGQVSILFGAKGPNLAVATACASGTHAVGESFRLIREGYADAMITGGSEAAICRVTVGGFCAMKALSTRNGEPEKASRPFDPERDGFVIAEGAGILILEEAERARARGARIYAEVAGYGLSGDAFHISAPSEDGDGPSRSMRMALSDAGLGPADIDYLNAHGTSTPAGDRIEVLAVKSVFGEHASRVAISSTKSMTGHLLGAAGGLETAVTALAVLHDRVPPTVNQSAPDPECDLDFVPNVSRAMTVRAAMNNSFGFGGTNATVLLKKFDA